MNERAILLSVAFDFYVYRNPSWPYVLPLDAPTTEHDWKRRAGFVYHSTGQNIRQMSNVVSEIDGVRQTQPADFMKLLASRKVVFPDTIPVYSSDYRRIEFSAAAKLRDLSGRPIELIHLGTAHGFGPKNKAYRSPDSTCSDSWQTWMVNDGLVSKITLIYPEWMRKFSDIGALGLATEDIDRLPENHPPIETMFLDDWRGFSRETPIAGFFGARQGGLMPPWCDPYYERFMSALPGKTIRHISGSDAERRPQIPRRWRDIPPAREEVDEMRAAPKLRVAHPTPEGIVVLYNGLPMPVK